MDWIWSYKNDLASMLIRHAADETWWDGVCLWGVSLMLKTNLSIYGCMAMNIVTLVNYVA
jgi:hypothetical protein